MKHSMLGLALGLFVMTGVAEAGVGDALKNTWSYLFSPINCVGNLVKDVGTLTVNTVYCVLGNLNRNPVTLTQIIQ